MTAVSAPADASAPTPEALRPPYGLFVAAVLGTLIVLVALLASQMLLGRFAGEIHYQTLETERAVSEVNRLDDAVADLVWAESDRQPAVEAEYAANRQNLALAIDRLLNVAGTLCDENCASAVRRGYQNAAELEDRACRASHAGDPALAGMLLASNAYRQLHATFHNHVSQLQSAVRSRIELRLAALRRWQTGFASAAVIGVGIIAVAWADAFRRLRRYERRSRQGVESVLESERRLRDLQHILRLAIDSMPQRLFWKSRDSRFLGCNEAMARDAGLSGPDAIIGLTDTDLPWAEHAADYIADDRAVMESGLSRLGIEEPFADSAGITHWLRTSKVPLRDHSGQIIGVMGTFEDVTRERETKEELKRAKEEAELASRAKSEFLANMSHEIRTPMTAILGFADLLCEPTLSPKQLGEYVETIRKNGEHLLSLINDILDLSKIESGRFEVERIPCSPAQIVADVHTLMAVRAATKSLPLEIEFASAIPQWIDSDPTRLRQILVNLVGNAVKFTEVGKVRIVVHCAERADNHLLCFDVIDTGIGMTRPQIMRLFRPFMQADASTRRMFGGTGLGLAISKRLAETLGGTLTVSSTPRQGSMFRLALKVTLPADVVWQQSPGGSANSRTTPVADGPQLLTGHRILLAEDGPDNRRLISHLLTRAGAEFRVVENGRDAVDFALRAAENGAPYHVILMDMQMPILDGYDATRLLRSRGYRGAIIALTAHAMSSDREVCIAAGCNDYATKPIKRQEFFETIWKWSGLAAKRPADPAPA